MRRPRICVLVDRIGWAYDVIAKALVVELPQYDFIIRRVDEVDAINYGHDAYDLIFCMGWKWPHREITTPKEKTISVCHSFRTLGPKHTIEEWCKYMTDRYCAMGSVNMRLQEMLGKYIPNVVYTPNGVDTVRFCPGPKKAYGGLTAGWSGRGDDLNFRGVHLMEIACKEAGWDLKLNIAQKTHIRHEDMPAFYQSLDLYFCLSKSEGCSCSMLEAAACGVPIIATDTGVSKEMVTQAMSGFVFSRKDLDERLGLLVDCMKILDRRECGIMGRYMRHDIEEHWTWAAQAPKWDELIVAGLASAGA